MPDDRSLYRYRSDRGEMLTEEDMEANFGDDITAQLARQRDVEAAGRAAVADLYE